LIDAGTEAQCLKTKTPIQQTHKSFVFAIYCALEKKTT